MKHVAVPFLLCSAVLTGWSGCNTSTPRDNVTGSPNNPVRNANPPPKEQREREFDFGPVLALGQNLRHEFSIANESDRPLRVLKAATSMPCCSGVGRLPKVIPPGGRSIVPVIIKTENKAGLLQIACRIETDSPTAPVRRFSVSVQLIPVWEVSAESGPVRVLPIGRPGKFTYRISCRRMGPDGTGLPDTVTTSGPIRVTLAEPAAESTRTRGVIETTRELDTELKPSPRAGFQRGEIVFRWADGRTRTQFVGWEVTPHIRVTPPGLVLSQSKSPIHCRLAVTSDDRPIRIIKVAGPFSSPFTAPSQSRLTHSLLIEADPSRVGPGGLTDITITTDHPDQPSVSVTLLLTAAAPGGER
jgi:hypothetical protein